VVLTVLAACTAVVALTYLESSGWIHRDQFQMHIGIWLSQIIMPTALGLAVYRSRHLLLQAVRGQQIELELRQKAEDELQRSEERFFKAFNFSPMPMSISRLSDGAYIEVNTAYERTLGAQRPQVLQRSDADIWPSAQSRADFVAALQAQGRVLGYLTRMRARQGEWLDVRIWAEIIDIEGEPCIMGATLNVTEEQRREGLLLEAARGVSVETGEAFFKVLVQHLGRALGADMALVGELQDADGQAEIRSLASMQQGQAMPERLDALAGTLAEQALTQQQPWILADGAGQRFGADALLQQASVQACAAVSLRDIDDTPIGVLLVGWTQPLQPSADVHSLLMIFGSRASSELVRLRRDRQIRRLGETLEQRVQERTAQLEMLNQELDAFAYSVAHDLKSPLRAIDGYTKLLTQQIGARLQPEERMLFERVLGATARMNELIADLLELARVSRSPVRPELVHFSELAQRVVQELQAASPQRQVHVHIQEGLQVRCDSKLARIVLENLLGNAWKYTRPTPMPHIELGRLPLHAEQDGVQLYVRDNGVGFDMAYAGELFKPFHRLHREAEFEGTGIGLATVHRIVQRHGGFIRCQAQLGQGATFFFSFERS